MQWLKKIYKSFLSRFKKKKRQKLSCSERNKLIGIFKKKNKNKEYF